MVQKLLFNGDEVKTKVAVYWRCVGSRQREAGISAVNYVVVQPSRCRTDGCNDHVRHPVKPLRECYSGQKTSCGISAGIDSDGAGGITA